MLELKQPSASSTTLIFFHMLLGVVPLCGYHKRKHQVSQRCNIYFWTCIDGHELFMSPQWCKRDVMFGNSHWSCCSEGRNVWHSEVMLWNYHGRCNTWGTIRETCNKLPRQQLVLNTNGKLLYPWRKASGMQLTPSPGVILLSCIFVECTAGGCSSTGSACIFG